MNAVPMMEVGFAAPAAERMPTVVAGMSWIELVLIARNVHMAFEATPGRGFSFSRSCMARRPSGVAALARPSILAAMFITIEPIAGWLTGTSGNNQRMIGRKAPARRFTRPDCSASRITPSHNAIIPASGKASVTTAVLQASKAAAVTSPSWPDAAPKRTDSTTSPSHIQFSMGESLSHAATRLRKAFVCSERRNFCGVCPD